MLQTELKKIHETLFVLHKCALTVERVYEAYDDCREKTALRSFAHFSHNLYYYTIMEAVSFLEEYDSFFTEANVETEFKQRVRDVRKIAKPLYKKIRVWKDFSQFRNKVVAHGWRNEKNGNRLTVPHRMEYDVPRTNFELQLLKDLIRQLLTLIEMEFEEESGWAIVNGYQGEKEKLPKKDFSNINAEMLQILHEMNAIAKELGRDYDIKITGYNWLENTAAKNETNKKSDLG